MALKRDNTKRRLLFHVLPLSSLLLASMPAMAADDLLFEMINTPAEIPEHAFSGRASTVKINHGILGKSRLEMDLFGEQVAAIRDRVGNDRGDFIWIGHLEDEAGSQVIITLRGNSVSGYIDRGNELYELTTNRQGEPIFIQVNEETLPPELSHPQPDLGASKSQNYVEGKAAVANNTQTVDLLVVYTPASCDRYGRDTGGGCNNLESRIMTAVAAANQAYLNSAIGMQINVAHMEEINYIETGDMSVSLSDLRNTSDSQMDSVHGLRNTHGADQVALISEDTNACGIAYVMQTESSSFASWAFSVTYSSCLTNQTLAHELGHNQGNQHDRANASFPGVADYAYGWRVCGSGGFRTVMSYSCSGATRINHFSNPDVFWNGNVTGIDYAVDPANAADNARSMNEVVDTVSAWRDSVSVTVPADPTSLSAITISHEAIDIDWIDNASDETGYYVERSLDGTGGWQQIASLGANTTTFSDSGLNPNTDYYYQVRAYNSAGYSNYSNVDFARTDDLPDIVDDVASGEILGAGTVVNDYTATHDDDGNVQEIRERESGGKPRNRYSYLQHTWQFDVLGGSAVTLFANAYSSGSSDGDSFTFAYSSNGIDFTPMFTVTSTQTSNQQTFALPASTVGTVYIRVTDTDQTAANRALDSIYVDQLYIQSMRVPGDPPTAPTGLMVTETGASSVSLSWADNSADELGFKILRDNVLVGTVGSDVTTFVDSSVQPASTYQYQVLAYNGSGESNLSNLVTADTPDGLSLSASGYKVKGKQVVDLSWNGSTGMVDVYRDNSKQMTTANDGAYTDNIGAKGGGSYTYMICIESTNDCSNAVQVVF